MLAHPLIRLAHNHHFALNSFPGEGGVLLLLAYGGGGRCRHSRDGETKHTLIWEDVKYGCHTNVGVLRCYRTDFWANDKGRRGAYPRKSALWLLSRPSGLHDESMKQYFVYILRCADGTYYTGVTNDLEYRFAEHQSGLHPGSYTFERRLLELVYSTAFNNVWDAIRFEKVVKGWSHKKKAAFIKGDEKLFKMASLKKFPVRYKRRCNTRIRAQKLSVRSSLIASFVRNRFAISTQDDKGKIVEHSSYENGSAVFYSE